MHSAFIDLFAEGISIKYLLIALFGKLGLLLLDRIFWIRSKAACLPAANPTGCSAIVELSYNQCTILVVLNKYHLR